MYFWPALNSSDSEYRILSFISFHIITCYKTRIKLFVIKSHRKRWLYIKQIHRCACFLIFFCCPEWHCSLFLINIIYIAFQCSVLTLEVLISLHFWKGKSCQTLVPHYQKNKINKIKTYLNQVNDLLLPFYAFSSITLGPLVHPFLKGLISCWIIDWICNRFFFHCELMRQIALCLQAQMSVFTKGQSIFVVVLEDVLVNHFHIQVKWNNYYFVY